MLKDRDFIFLELEDALIIHSIISKHGTEENAGQGCNRALLESAVNSARNLYYYEPSRDVFHVAAHLGYHIAKNHAFENGNKRTAYMAMFVFFRMNGMRHRAASNLLEEAYQQVEWMVDGSFTIEQYASYLRERLKTYEKNSWWNFILSFLRKG